MVDARHIPLLRDGAILANSGHFNAEIDIPTLEKLSNGKKREVKPYVEEYTINGKAIFLLGEGRLINLAAAEGHPASVMDMSFANQALCAEYLVAEYKNLNNEVYTVPEAIDHNVAALKLKSMGVEIDVLTPEQAKYLSSWNEGTA